MQSQIQHVHKFVHLLYEKNFLISDVFLSYIFNFYIFRLFVNALLAKQLQDRTRLVNVHCTYIQKLVSTNIAISTRIWIEINDWSTTSLQPSDKYLSSAAKKILSIINLPNIQHLMFVLAELGLLRTSICPLS